MSTINQIEANRLNAQKSTGPRSPEGKSVTRLNALKHGLFATDPVIQGEDPALFDALRDGIYRDFQPANTDEHVIVAAMVRDAWLLERCANAESAVWSRAFIRERNEDEPFSLAQRHLEKSLLDLQRRVDSAQRNYRRNRDIMKKLVAAREKGRAVPETVPEPVPSAVMQPAQPKSPHPLNPEIGSVPPNPQLPGRIGPKPDPNPLSEAPKSPQVA